MITTSVYKMAAQFVEIMKWSVIPLKPNSKEPLIDWKEYQKRLPSRDELTKWFGNQSQNNIGIVTGAISNLSVLDADELKNLPQLFSSIVVLTKRGRHLYFKFSGETNSASKIAKAIDVRGEGGFVVAPPSVVDGHKYRFLSPVVNVNRLTDFPRELLNGKERQTNGEAKPLDWMSQALNSLTEGTRNATFTQIVGRLHRDRHSSDTILSLLGPHAERVGFDLGELNNVIQSVTRYENRQGTGYEIHTEENKAEDIEEFLKGEEKVEWIVQQVLSKSGIAFCAGLPESLKTFLLIDLAIECARVNGNWMGLPVNRVKTLFIDQERFIGETRRRFKKMLKGKGLTGASVKDYLNIQVGSSIRLNLDESFQAFRRKLHEIKPELIIVDSFATFSTVAENDRKEVQTVLERIKQIRQEFGCTVLMIDHENKGVLNPETRGDVPNAFSMIGSVGKPAAAETVFTVRKDKADSVTLYHTKSTLGPSIAPISFQIQDTPDGGIRLVTL